MAASLLGRPLWYELMTTDLDAAEKFYTTVVGWTITPFEGSPTGKYSMWTRDGNVSIGGAMSMPKELRAQGVPPHWMMYVGVPNLEDATAHAERLGGATLSPHVIDIPNVGRMRIMKDPQSAAFAIYQPASPPPRPEAPPELGDVSWIELLTTNAEAAMKFYQELFGWRPTEAMDMGPAGQYHMFGRDLGSMGGMFNRRPEMGQMPPSWWPYFRVPDVQAAAERAKANGGKVLNGPMEVPGGDWIVQCADPQGAVFALHHKKK